MRAARLGDDIDDFCIKCKRVMNHAVVSILKDEPAKVRCRTCHSDHDFRHEQPPPPKVDPRKASLFNEVLANVTGAQPAPDLALSDDPANADGMLAQTSEIEQVGIEEPNAAPDTTKADTKPKGRKKAKA
jgi:hypothetical protein